MHEIISGQSDALLGTIYRRRKDVFDCVERRFPLVSHWLATKCGAPHWFLRRWNLGSKDNHRPAQCRQSDRSLNSSDTIVTRWMRTDKRSCIAGQIIVAAAISLRNLANTHTRACGRRQVSPIKRESLQLFIQKYLYTFSPPSFQRVFPITF